MQPNQNTKEENNNPVTSSDSNSNNQSVEDQGNKLGKFASFITAELGSHIDKKLDERLADISIKLESINITSQAVLLRLESLETLYKSSNSGKKVVKTNATTVTNNKTQVATKTNRISNSLLFFRAMVGDNKLGYREKYITQDRRTNVSGNATVQKKGKPEEGNFDYWSAVGLTVWPTMEPSEKEAIKADFIKWKSSNAVTVDQLEAGS
jgi:hypothetical protein